jgi:hypothetical protein
VKRSSVVALVVVGLTALCVGAVCLGATAIGPGTILGCDTDPTPAVPTVQDDPHQVAELFPRLVPHLGEVRTVHWQIRDARPRTCPDLGPMDYVYDGLVVPAADPVAGFAFAPAGAPAIPPGLAELAPPGAAWQVSGAFDTAMGGKFWFDPGSHTLYFHLLKG